MRGLRGVPILLLTLGSLAASLALLASLDVTTILAHEITQEEVDALIEKLCDDDIEVRREARGKLVMEALEFLKNWNLIDQRLRAKMGALCLEGQLQANDILRLIAVPSKPNYKCYTISQEALGVRASLRDQFGLRPARINLPQFLCAPALRPLRGYDEEEELEKLERQFPHLKCYTIAVRARHKVMVIKDLKTEFTDEERVSVSGPSTLCLPVIKELLDYAPTQPQPVPEKPHYTCYALGNTHTPNVPVTLRTQFGREEGVMVGQATSLCAPTLKNPSGPEEEQKKKLKSLEGEVPHLKCYHIDGDTVHEPAHLESQFSTEFVEIIKAVALCVPVLKFPIP